MTNASKNIKDMTEDELIDEYSYHRDMMDYHGAVYNRNHSEKAWENFDKADQAAKACYDLMIERGIRVRRRTL